MRGHDIRGVTRRRRRSLTRPDAKAKPAPVLIGRDFHAERPGLGLTLQARSFAALTDRVGNDLSSGAQPVPAAIDRQVASGLVELLSVEPDRGAHPGMSGR